MFKWSQIGHPELHSGSSTARA